MLKSLILVADCTRPFGVSVAGTLNNMGADAVCCKNNFSEIGGSLAEKKYDAVFLPCYDDGDMIFEFIRGIKDRYPDIKVFAAVYTSSVRFKSRLIEAGAEYCFELPCTERSLCLKMIGLIGGCDLHSRITVFLDEYGFPKNLDGYNYLISAMKLCIVEPSRLMNLLSEVYDKIAKEYDTDSSIIEHSLRTLSKNAIKSGIMQRLTGGRINKKITNYEFICAACDNFVRFI